MSYSFQFPYSIFMYQAPLKPGGQPRWYEVLCPDDSNWADYVAGLLHNAGTSASDLHSKKWSPQSGELAHRLFVHEGTHMLECGMSSCSVIERLDEIKGHTPGLCSCLK